MHFELLFEFFKLSQAPRIPQNRPDLAPDKPKIDQKIDLNFDVFLSSFLHDFWNRFGAPKWSPNRPKLNLRMRSCSGNVSEQKMTENLTHICLSPCRKIVRIIATVVKFMLSLIFATARGPVQKNNDLGTREGAKMVPKWLRTVLKTRF